MSHLPKSEVSARERPRTAVDSRRSDARRNRQAILQAAASIFDQQGWEAGMHDVAVSAGVGMGTVYRHFPSKEIVLGALLARRFEATTARVREISTGAGPPFARLSRALKASGADAAGDRVGRMTRTRAGPRAWEHAGPARLEFEQAFAPMIDEARRDGSLRSDFSTDDVGALMAAVCAVVNDADPTRWEHILDIAIDGLRAR